MPERKKTAAQAKKQAKKNAGKPAKQPEVAVLAGARFVRPDGSTYLSIAAHGTPGKGTEGLWLEDGEGNQATLYGSPGQGMVLGFYSKQNLERPSQLKGLDFGLSLRDGQPAVQVRDPKDNSFVFIDGEDLKALAYLHDDDAASRGVAELSDEEALDRLMGYGLSQVEVSQAVRAGFTRRNLLIACQTGGRLGARVVKKLLGTLPA